MRIFVASGHKIQFLRPRRRAGKGSRAEGTNSWVNTIYRLYLHKQETWHKCAGSAKNSRFMRHGRCSRIWATKWNVRARARRKRNNKRRKKFLLESFHKMRIMSREEVSARVIHYAPQRNVTPKVCIYISTASISPPVNFTCRSQIWSKLKVFFLLFF